MKILSLKAKYHAYKAEMQRRRKLNKQLEGLTNHNFINDATQVSVGIVGTMIDPQIVEIDTIKAREATAPFIAYIENRAKLGSNAGF